MPITQPSTGLFFESPSAGVNRLNDRVLIGAATQNDARNPNVIKDWLEATINATTSVAQTASLSTIGAAGFVSGTRSSDSSGFWGFGTMSFAINDRTTSPLPAWAYYGEARRSAGAGLVHCLELGVINHGDTGQIDPYSVWENVTSINTWLSCGRPDVTAGDATVALGIVNNSGTTTSGRYSKGVVFDNNAIVGTDGITGEGSAIAFAKGHQVEWYSAAQQPPVAAVGCVNGYGAELYSQGQRCIEAHKPISDETGILLAVNRSGTITIEAVKIGAPDSGGTGKRSLVVNN